MEVDPHELVVRWYLRFNGYLGVENFVIHQAVQNGNVQVGEDDVLAVRFPSSREDPGFLLETDEHLVDAEAREHGLVDFVVAEVKGGRKDTLNSVWQPPSNPTKVDRVRYLIRWLGPLADDEEINRVSTELQASHRSRSGQYLFRVLLFGRKVQPQLTLPQLTFKDIARFFVCVRAPCWQDRGFGARSPHNQWHPFIKELWTLADPSAPGDQDTKIDSILHRLKSAAEQRAGADSASA